MRPVSIVEAPVMQPKRLALLLVLALGAGACGDDGAPATDAGPIAGDAEVDGSLPAQTPVVVATFPADGQVEVARDATLSVAFDRAMDASAGALTATVDGEAVALEAGAWDSEARVYTVRPSAALPPGATVTVTAGTDYRSAEGVRLAAAHTWTFETRDDVAPVVTGATPDEGESAVPAELEEIVIAFSEPMRPDGLARLEGGPGELGRGSWADGALHLPVRGLAPETSYRVLLEGFRDEAGNGLDPVPVLGDGALDFTTGADTAAPVVVGSNPSEGQLDVRVGLITRVSIDFSEAMDASVGSANLEGGGSAVALEARWARGDTRVTFDVAGRLAIDTAYRVVLAGFADPSGLALDGAVYLGDGALDFTTGTGALTPFVAHTEPLEGSAVLAHEHAAVRVVFSEAMDTSRTTVELDDGYFPQTLAGTWNDAGTVLSLEAAGRIHAGSAYTVDLSGFQDITGTAVDTSHPYLGDGILSFTTVAGGGERCGDAIGMGEGTPITGGMEWVLPAGTATFNDGSAGCATFIGGPDAVVHYRKTTAAASAGGTVLEVTVTNPTSTSTGSMNVAVYAGRCDLGDEATLRRCVYGRNPWRTYVDGGPGDYFIWVGRTSNLSFNGATVRVEERPLPGPGEGCLAPWTTATPSPIYTAPAEDTRPHRWEIPGVLVQAYDMGTSIGGPGAISCVDGGRHGPDTVVRIDKTSGTSLLNLRVSANGSGTSPVQTHVEVLDTCDTTSAAARSLACYPGLLASSGHREMTLEGPAGSHWVWLAAQSTGSVFPGATVEATEFEPAAGDSCATAIPVMPGTTHAITATRPYRAHVPECLASGGVTWVRYTPTQGLGILRTTGATTAAVVEPGTGRTLRCAGDDTGQGVPVFGVPGSPVCVALTSAASVTSLTIDEIPYSGVRGIETVLPTNRPTGVSSVSTLGWMAVQGSTLYRGQSNQLAVPITGGDLSDVSFPSTLSRNGGAALARPDGLYVLASTTSPTTPRLYRARSATGALLEPPEAVDVLPAGFEYPARRFDALTWDGSRFLVATAQATTALANPDCCTTVTFWAIPTDGTPPVQIGANDTIDDVSALAADATFVYVYGRSGADEAIWRLRRDLLADPAQAPVELLTGYELSNDNGSLYVDSTTEASALYLRLYARTTGSTHGSDVMLIARPGGETPAWVGPLWRSGSTRTDNGMAYDPAGPALYIVDTTTPFTSDGRWIRFD